jgi:hypothetical protein
MAGKVSAGRCASGYSYASISGDSSIASPTLARTHSGYSYFYLTWNLAVIAKAALFASPATGNYSYSGASISGTASAYLVDVTNGSYSYVSTAGATLFGASFTSNGKYMLSTAGTTSYMYLWGDLVKGDHYQILIYVDVSVSVYMYNVSGSASASVDLAGTHGLTITGISQY